MTAKPRPADKTIAARFPDHLANAIGDAARERLMSTSTFVRQAVAEKLTRDGFISDTTTRPRRAN